VVTVSAKANFRRLGKAYGARMKEASAIIETFTNADIVALESGVKHEVLGVLVGLEDIEIRRTRRDGVQVETDGAVTVALNVEISPALLAEGHAREFVNRIQNMRKANGYNVSDRIVISYHCATDLHMAILEYKEYICSETLAIELERLDTAPDSAEILDINSMSLSASISRPAQETI
jgi:isoleucyl-tRNA synthetase